MIGAEARKPPPPPAKLGEPEWKPKLSSMTAAKAGAGPRHRHRDVKLGRTVQIPTNQIVDWTPADAADVTCSVRSSNPVADSQADAVPPIVVRKTAGGGYQVLDGDAQFLAAKHTASRRSR